MSDALLALWFFAPAGIANVMPILAAKAPGLQRWHTPVDGGKTWRGQRLFGDHKTWRGVVTGTLAGMAFLWLQVSLGDHYAWAANINQELPYGDTAIWLLGFLLGFGGLAGDMIKSFVKRQVPVKAGDSWFPFDQLDYIIGGLLLSALVVQLPVAVYVWVLIIFFGLHLLFSYIGYKLHFKAKPI
jgi:CDP-2,3-bis-(O-geranylgeranyl)-sn-glycerol synthase